MSAFNRSPQRGFGYSQYINFGKHKGKTWYEVANAGDYGYLKWCLRNDLRSAPDPQSFFISDTCLPHIRTALLTETNDATPWSEEYSDPNPQGRVSLKYVACSTKDPNKWFESEPIEMKRCRGCNQLKTLNTFESHQVYCRKCQFAQSQQQMKIRKIDATEFKKGAVSSYKPKNNTYMPPHLRAHDDIDNEPNIPEPIKKKLETVEEH